MKLGLITDIHEDAELLHACLLHLQKMNVESIIALGDVCDMGHRLDETCNLLREFGVVGVWGNHDYGMCLQPEIDLTNPLLPTTKSYMQALTSQVVLEDCYFAHIEPWLDPNSMEDLWFFDGTPDTPDRRLKIFQTRPQRILFAGHYHLWMLLSPEGAIDWNGREPICLKNGQYFVVLDAVLNGACATYETDSGWLTPIHIPRTYRIAPQ